MKITAAKRTEREGIQFILGRLQKQLEIDEKKYADLLDEGYFFGHLDGQKKAIRLVEEIFFIKGKQI